MIKNFFCFFFFIISTIFASENNSTPTNEDEKVKQVSEALGHLIVEDINNLGVKVDIFEVIKGIQGATTGQTSPISKEECFFAINAYQQQAIHEQSQKNLQEAENFLSQNSLKKEIVEMEKNKLQYEILKTGDGKTVSSTDSPVIRYTATLLNGTTLSTAEADHIFNIDEMILGLKKNLIDMKEQEIRKIYIHPEFAYKENLQDHPNSLLIFEVTVLQAHKEVPTEGMKEIAQIDTATR